MAGSLLVCTQGECFREFVASSHSHNTAVESCPLVRKKVFRCKADAGYLKTAVPCDEIAREAAYLLVRAWRLLQNEQSVACDMVSGKKQIAIPFLLVMVGYELMLFYECVVHVSRVVELYYIAVECTAFDAYLVDDRSLGKSYVPFSLEICVYCYCRNIVIKAIVPAHLHLADIVADSCNHMLGSPFGLCHLDYLQFRVLRCLFGQNEIRKVIDRLHHSSCRAIFQSDCPYGTSIPDKHSLDAGVTHAESVSLKACIACCGCRYRFYSAPKECCQDGDDSFCHTYVFYVLCANTNVNNFLIFAKIGIFANSYDFIFSTSGCSRSNLFFTI